MRYFKVYYIHHGKKYKKTIQAQDRNNALAVLQLENIGVIIKIVEIASPVQDRLRNITNNSLKIDFKHKIKMPQLIASIRQLSVMTNAGISIHNSIKEVAKTTKDKTLKKIFASIDDDLNAGNSLTASILPFKNDLGEVTLAMTQLGENTGNMGSALDKLAKMQEDIWDNKQKFKKAIRYPLVVTITIAIAFSVLMIYVVPKFKTIFEKFQAKLPLPTRILLEIEDAIHKYGLYGVGFFIVLAIATYYMYNNNKATKKWADRYILKLYLIGDIVFYSSMSRFQLIFTELVCAGIPITKALDTATLTISNKHIQQKLSSVKRLVENGNTLTKSFEETSLYESMLIQMINAGEQSGNLDFMLGRVSEYFKSKFSNILDNITSLIEPILIGFIALIVLFLALGIFMPMWDMAQVIRT